MSLDIPNNGRLINLNFDTSPVAPECLIVGAIGAPALVISGTLDDLVPARHGEWIAEEYKKVGVEHRLLLLEADHGLTGKQTEALKAVADWFDEQLKPSRTQQ